MEPRLVARDVQLYLAIPTQVMLSEWGQASVLTEEVLHWHQTHDVPDTPSPFFRYRVLGDMDNPFHLEVGWTVPEPPAGDERVNPGGRYVSTVHHGHPDRPAEAIARMDAWLDEHGMAWDINHEAEIDFWAAWFAVYLTNPAEQPDMEQWTIELLWKVTDEE